ncbi:hypothetical protein V6N12_063455 [Hibiscus sabdariffa]|uniref:Uncharacterized protein n=1 Tax=Hibiscus sabdariffa TaxID=183260 RepID=A0ABR2FBS0_9ROSI
MECWRPCLSTLGFISRIGVKKWLLFKREEQRFNQTLVIVETSSPVATAFTSLGEDAVVIPLVPTKDLIRPTSITLFSTLIVMANGRKPLLCCSRGVHPPLLLQEQRFTSSAQFQPPKVILPRFSIQKEFVGRQCRPLPSLLVWFLHLHLTLFSWILPDLEFRCTSVPMALSMPSTLMMDHGNG